jgi:hypothetical protein
VLAGQSDHPTDRHRLSDRVDARHQDSATVGSKQGGQDPDQGGLPGPVGAEKGRYLTFSHLHAQTVEGDRLAEGLGHLGDFDDGRSSHR